MNLAQLERDLAAKKTEGQAALKRLTAAAESENRLFTDEEKKELKAIQDDTLALTDRIARARGDEDMVREIERLTAAGAASAERDGRAVGAATSTPRGTMGEQFVNAKEYEFFKRGGHRTQSAWRSDSVELFPRAATLTEDAGSGGPLVVPQYLPGILPLPQRRLVVADLIAPGTTDSNAISYFKEKTWTNAAATVAEAANKPESTLVFEAATAPVRKIATWLPVSEEMLEDVPAIRSYIDARLSLGVLMTEETQLLNGDGVAPNILGIRAQTGLAADVARDAAEPNFDAILKQIMAIYASSFLMPDGIVMNPADWTTTILTKGAQGQYYTPGPFQPIQAPTLWGLPVAITPAMTAGVALVGAYRMAAQVFRKGGIRVEASNSHADFFIKNLIAIRAEERLALAVYRPGAFGEVTGLGPVDLTP